MKIILTIVFLISGLTLSQTITDSSSNKPKVQKQEESLKIEKQSEKSQIGAKSNPSEKENSSRKKKDVFIDKDGDGICDSRQSGMSFNKLRQRLGSGQKGPSKGKHGSGSGNGNQNGFGNGN
ncbi:MAG: hypothetical protein HXY50_04600 [Ignavibacteriaceae bacterium]|nr:hypothetical protein [Ignavibacteriaceae bacterium]